MIPKSVSIAHYHSCLSTTNKTNFRYSLIFFPFGIILSLNFKKYICFIFQGILWYRCLWKVTLYEKYEHGMSYDHRWYVRLIDPYHPTTWWSLNLIESKSSKIAESSFGYLKLCSLIVQRRKNPKKQAIGEKSQNLFFQGEFTT